MILFEVRKLYPLLDVKTYDRGALLKEINNRFGRNLAYSSLKNSLERMGLCSIPPPGFSSKFY